MTRQGAIPAAAGIAAGLLGALGLTRFLDAYLFEVARLDPHVYAAVLAVLQLVYARAMTTRAVLR
jgi:hypothetical protein